MPACPHCGATVPEGAVYCVNCGAAINSPAASLSTSQPQVASQGSSGDMSARLEKAMRRAELLSYAVAGLGVAILFVIILIAFL
ncbi:zinc-ribbon domain-containing protein [Candidatus Bathyarchaeota archaeon]|nr:zinc-ribbon domain-containing protein [Candidatus Bathyarchaeota archaeon]